MKHQRIIAIQEDGYMLEQAAPFLPGGLSWCLRQWVTVRGVANWITAAGGGVVPGAVRY